MTWEIHSNIALPVFVAIILVGIYLILKLAKNKTSKVSSLRLFIQINSVVAIFMGLVLGPFDTPLWQPMGPSPRSLLVGSSFLKNQFPDGFSVPVLACYYSNGRTVTCALWQLQAYIFPYWNFSNGYEAIYSTSGLEKIGIVMALLVIAVHNFGKVLLRLAMSFWSLHGRVNPNSQNLTVATFALFRKNKWGDCTITVYHYCSYFNSQRHLCFIRHFRCPAYSRHHTWQDPRDEAGNVGNLEQPFCLVCPMRPLCILIECALGEMKFSYVSKITSGPFWTMGFYVTSINLAVLIAITVLALAYRRFWCRICPLGGLTALFSTFTPFKQIAMTRLNKNEQKCTKCGVCKRVCPTQATGVYEKKGGDVTESRCILCARCVEECPYEGALTLKVAGKTVMNSRNWLEQQ